MVDGELESLMNLGPASIEMLNRAGIATREQLRELGAVRAFLAVKQSGSRPSLNLLWALAGALSGTPWNQLAPALKQRLRNELASLDAEEHL